MDASTTRKRAGSSTRTNSRRCSRLRRSRLPPLLRRRRLRRSRSRSSSCPSAGLARTTRLERSPPGLERSRREGAERAGEGRRRLAGAAAATEERLRRPRSRTRSRPWRRTRECRASRQGRAASQRRRDTVRRRLSNTHGCSAWTRFTTRTCCGSRSKRSRRRSRPTGASTKTPKAGCTITTLSRESPHGSIRWRMNSGRCS
mmetsp:Transcript_24182/g.78799  ORF Transcript_24182/g.78799 Transcript_24182/m.78799 type:complete len:202 (+) Transcript_24182:638-1243(+)